MEISNNIRPEAKQYVQGIIKNNKEEYEKLELDFYLEFEKAFPGKDLKIEGEYPQDLAEIIFRVLFKNEATYAVDESSLPVVHCAAGKRRSIQDLFLVARFYFPVVGIRRIFDYVNFMYNENMKLHAQHCSVVQRIVHFPTFHSVSAEEESYIINKLRNSDLNLVFKLRRYKANLTKKEDMKVKINKLKPTIAYKIGMLVEHKNKSIGIIIGDVGDGSFKINTISNPRKAELKASDMNTRWELDSISPFEGKIELQND